MKKSRLAAGLAAALLVADAAGQAAAAGANCLLAADIEAEQAIRYETEIMVLSDTCGSDSYRDFTVHNQQAIRLYQNQLMERFRRAGARNPRASLDGYLTKMANERALAAARERTQVICGRSAPVLAEAKELRGEQFRRHIASLAAENGKGYRRCSG